MLQIEQEVFSLEESLNEYELDLIHHVDSILNKKITTEIEKVSDENDFNASNFNKISNKNIVLKTGRNVNNYNNSNNNNDNRENEIVLFSKKINNIWNNDIHFNNTNNVNPSDDYFFNRKSSYIVNNNLNNTNNLTDGKFKIKSSENSANIKKKNIKDIGKFIKI